MGIKPLLLSAAALSILAGPATALELTNNDDATYQVEIVIGEGDSTTESYELETDQFLSDVCAEGCTIKLSNGAEQAFAGDEIVSIKDGKFVITE